jgi:hypothetical protein
VLQKLGTSCFKQMDAYARSQLRASLMNLPDNEKLAVLCTLDEHFDDLKRDSLITSRYDLPAAFSGPFDAHPRFVCLCTACL